MLGKGCNDQLLYPNLSVTRLALTNGELFAKAGRAC